MPSHIFTRVGAWEDSAATNARSEQTARADKGIDEILHAIDYQVYAYLQMARDADAKKAMERGIADAAKMASIRPSGPFAIAAVPARYALERGDWKAAAQLAVMPTKLLYVNAIPHFARGIGAARSGDAAAARLERERLAELRNQLAAAKNSYWTEQVEIQLLAVSAWTALAEGKRDEALTLMREAADKETASEKSPISPGPILPARELLGDMLIALGQPAVALKEYEASQQREPNRFRGWYWRCDRSREIRRSCESKDLLRKARRARTERRQPARASAGASVPGDPINAAGGANGCGGAICAISAAWKPSSPSSRKSKARERFEGAEDKEPEAAVTEPSEDAAPKQEFAQFIIVDHELSPTPAALSHEDRAPRHCRWPRLWT